MKKVYLLITMLLFIMVQFGHSQDGELLKEVTIEKNEKTSENIDADGFYMYFGYNLPIGLYSGSSLKSYGALDMGFHKAWYRNKTELINVGADFGFFNTSIYGEDIVIIPKVSIGPYFAITKNNISVYTSYKVGYAFLLLVDDISNYNNGFAHDVNIGFVVKKFSIRTSVEMNKVAGPNSFNALKFGLGFRL